MERNNLLTRPMHWLLIGLLALFAGSVQAATITIDDFTSSHATTGSAVGDYWDYLNDPSVLGGNRDLVVGITDNTSGNNGELRSGVGGDFLSLNFDSGVTGYGFVVWDGLDSTPNIDESNSFDLTDSGTNDRFVVQIASTDLSQELTLRVYGDTESDYMNYNWTVPAFTTNTTYEIAFSSFTTAGAGANFSDAGAMLMGMSPNDPSALGGDLRIDYVAAAPVPEPGTWALLMFGGGAAWWRRRTRKDASDA